MDLEYSQGEGVIDNREFIRRLSNMVTKFPTVQDAKDTIYYNIPAAFDIETTSFYDGGTEKENRRGIMYHWQFGIYNIVTFGRTWVQLTRLLDAVSAVMGLDERRILVVYIHNLSYEWQWIRKRFIWQKVFLMEERVPLYIRSNGIEFRCSYKLSGKSLENVGKSLIKYICRKMVGDLDYNLIRTPLTPMTAKELKYCENDIRVLLCFIQEKIEQDRGIGNIPYTNTGYVRRFCRKACFEHYKEYRQLMEELTMDIDEYKQCRRAFQGGFTHANAKYVDSTIENVSSYDISSSYPGVMVLDKFPMSRCRIIERIESEQEFENLLLTKCCLFDIEFFGLRPRLYHENPLSISKCAKDKIHAPINAIVNNGRVVMAEYVLTTCTEEDYWIYKEFYMWDSYSVYNLRVYDKGYLPRDFILAILKMYSDKTLYKGDDEHVVTYNLMKSMLNANYGMAVMVPIREEWNYENNTPALSLLKSDEEKLEKYNKSKKRFLFYPWGVWVTAHARARLFSSIAAMGADYVYADTDCNKHLHPELHTDFFKAFNENIMRQIEASSKFNNIPIEMFQPKDKDGHEHPIGIFEHDGTYSKFKTLGAKRYLTLKHVTDKPFEDGELLVQLTRPELTCTVAGSNKFGTARYLHLTTSPFEHFQTGLSIPSDHSKRSIVTYIDCETEGSIVDYTGQIYYYHELSSVHMEGTEYTFKRSPSFEDFLENLEEFSQ